MGPGRPPPLYSFLGFSAAPELEAVDAALAVALAGLEHGARKARLVRRVGKALRLEADAGVARVADAAAPRHEPSRPPPA